MIGVELKEKAAPYISALRDAGVITINAGATVIRFVPPLDYHRGRGGRGGRGGLSGCWERWGEALIENCFISKIPLGYDV